MILITAVPFPDSFHLGNDEIVHASQDESSIVLFHTDDRPAIIRWCDEQVSYFTQPFAGCLDAPFQLVLSTDDLIAYGTDDDKPDQHDPGCFIWFTIRRIEFA